MSGKTIDCRPAGLDPIHSDSFVRLEDLDSSFESPSPTQHSPLPKTRGTPMHILPLYDQPSQVINVDPHDLHNSHSSTPSHYFAIGSSTLNGVTKYTLVRKPRRYRVRPPPTSLAAVESTLKRRLLDSLKAAQLRKPVQAEQSTHEVGECSDDEIECCLAVNRNPQPSKRPKPASRV